MSFDLVAATYARAAQAHNRKRRAGSTMDAPARRLAWFPRLARK